MDWTSIISALVAKGLTHAQIASLCGCGQSTITDLALRKSREPRYALGRSLIDLSQQGKVELAKQLIELKLAKLKQAELEAA